MPGHYDDKKKTKAQKLASKRIVKKKVKAKVTAVKTAVKKGLTSSLKSVKTVGKTALRVNDKLKANRKKHKDNKMKTWGIKKK